jgi:uncharacterized protein (TIGR00251 family)
LDNRLRIRLIFAPDWSTLRIQPGAPKNEIVGFANGVWKIKIAAPPVEGKANKELIDYLSEVLDVAKSSITIIKGEKGRDKTILIVGLSSTLCKI